MAELPMPSLGADMTVGKLVAWHVRPGDAVARGDIVATVETDKADVDVEVFRPGLVERLLVEPGETVPVGTPLAILRSPDEEPGVPAAPMAPSGPPAPRPEAVPGPPALPSGERGRRILISPAARALAAARGIDPATVVGTGPSGRIQERDVEAAAAPSPPAAPEAGLDDRQARMRRAIAAAMERANREVPHYHLEATVDLTAATAWLAEENLRRPVAQRLLPGLLLLRAAALALAEVPELNGVWRDGRFTPAPAVHLGVAISLRGGGLVAPALHDAATRPLDQLMAAFRDLVGRARAGSLRSSELTDPTATVTSLGERGAESVHGVIFPPQVALVGFGAIVERPWIREGQVIAAPLVRVTLAADHRASDGHVGSLLLAAIDRLLQEPERL